VSLGCETLPLSQISASLRFRWLTAPSMVDEIMQAQLLTCWRDVSNAGGAVGFPFLPATTEQVRAAIDALIGSLDPSLNRILVATVDHTLAGWPTASSHAGRVGSPRFTRRRSDWWGDNVRSCGDGCAFLS
jgi:hypothetical protein